MSSGSTYEITDVLAEDIAEAAILNGNNDDDNGMQDEVAIEEDNTEGDDLDINIQNIPWIPDMYKISRAQCGSESTERGFRPVWKFWLNFCAHQEKNPAYKSEDGLDLYQPDAISNKRPENYNHVQINAFFTWLQDQPGISYDKMKKAVSFINAHLKCEYHTKVKKAILASTDDGSRVFIPGALIIGKDVVVSKALKYVQKKTATVALATCDDLLADVDNRISEEECRNMLLYIFQAKADGEVSRTNKLYRLMFGASFTAAFANVRRGEEFRNQRIVQGTNENSLIFVHQRYSNSTLLVDEVAV